MDADEIIIFVCTVAGTIIAYLTFVQPSKDLKELKQLTLEKLEFLEALHIGLISEIERYAYRYNCYQNEFMQGISFKQGLALLENVQKEIVQTSLKSSIRKSKSKARLEEIKKHLETQIQHHSEVETHYNLFINPAK